MSEGYFNEDIIASIITAPNALAAIGIIRVSGAGALELVTKLLGTEKELHSHRLVHRTLRDRQGNALDDVMVVYMKAPNSFTGEDVVEVHAHGNPILLKRVMQELIASGAREAHRGEFSFRAFRNGKLSLDQAESIADLISSQTSEGMKRSLDTLLGNNKTPLEKIKADLVSRLAEVEIDIDFSDQGLSSLDYKAWSNKLEQWCQEVEMARQEFLRNQPLREGIRVSLYGEPNSGKSSLFNKLLGENRSIVNEAAGTTRDVVRESVYLDGLLLRFSDTAGVRETLNEIEAEGIERSREESLRSDLVLWILDGKVLSTQGMDSFLRQKEPLFESVPKEKVLAIWNKSDLAKPEGAEWENALKGINFIELSAKTGDGLGQLRERIQAHFHSSQDQSPSFLISRMRHFEVLGSAVKAVKQAILRVSAGETFPDLLAGDLRQALSCLGEITGEFTTDDLLTHIFSEFCIGK